MHIENKIKALVFVLVIAVALFVSVPVYLFAAKAQTSSPPTASTVTLNSTYIAHALGTSLVLSNSQSGIVTAILVRQSPNINEPGGVVDNKFTLMNSVVEFWLLPGATSTNQTVYARGFFGLLENETTRAIAQAVAYNMTILNIHPFSPYATPNEQFLHWQTVGNLSTVISNIKSIVGNTSIGTTPTITPQTALNATYIASRINGKLIDGPVVDISISRQDGNITAPGNFTNTGNTTVVLNSFATMSTLFEFMPWPPTSTSVNATSGNVMVMGDFALKSNEVMPVEKVLMNSTAYPLVNVTVTAIHSHMLMETPEITFLHFEAMGDLNQTITMINMALNQTTTFGNNTATKTS